MADTFRTIPELLDDFHSGFNDVSAQDLRNLIVSLSKQTLYFLLSPPFSSQDLSDAVVYPYFTVPPLMDGWKLTRALATLKDACNSGDCVLFIDNLTEDVHLLETDLTIDQSTRSSDDSVSPYAIASNGDQIVSSGDHIAIRASALGSGGSGLAVQLEFSYPIS